MGMITTRRAMLGSVTAIGAAVALPSAAMSMSSTSTSPELAALIAEADRQDGLAAAFERDVYRPAQALATAQCDAVPHINVPAHYRALDGSEERVWSTADPIAVRSALFATKGRVSFHGPGSEDARRHYRCQRRLAAAHRWRERKVARIRRETGFDAAYADSDRLSDLVYTADMAVAHYPAATLPDLLAVLAFMERRGLADDQHCIDILSAGIRRLAGEA